MIFTLAAYLQFAQAWAVAFAERPQVLNRCCCKVHYTLRDCQSSGNEKGFNIQPVGFWPVKTHGWNACVNPARQHQLQSGLTGSLQNSRKKIWEVLNALITVRQFMPLVGSSHPGAHSEYAFIGNVRLLGWSRCSWDELVLGAQPEISMFFFLTFFVKWDNNVIHFLENQTTVFKQREQWIYVYFHMECRVFPSWSVFSL